MTQKEPKVYVVDDDDRARNSVRALVRSMNIDVETYSSAEAFLKEFDSDLAGCLITDVRMDGMSGIELQERLVADSVSLPVIIITAHAETPLTVKAVKLGAVTVLEKPCRDYELYDAIRGALAQDALLRAQTTIQRRFRERLSSLNDSEKQVLELMVEGVANKVIAQQLDVSLRTIENRRQRIFEKTETASLAELIKLYVTASDESS